MINKLTDKQRYNTKQKSVKVEANNIYQPSLVNQISN